MIDSVQSVYLHNKYMNISWEMVNDKWAEGLGIFGIKERMPLS